MEKSLPGKSDAPVEAETETEATDVIDLVEESDSDNDGENDTEEAVLLKGPPKKRRSSGEASVESPCDADVIDLVDDSPAKGTRKKPRATENSSSSSSASTGSAANVEVIDLVDCGDDAMSSNDESKHKNNVNVHGNKIDQTAQDLVLEPDDTNAILTHGILERMHALSTMACDHCWTCLGSIKTVSTTADAPSASADFASTVGRMGGSPAHIQQKDTWSCGYRNYQMMLSALLPRLREKPHHSIFSKLPRRLPPTPISLPSLGRIQASMEDAWREGFDPDGAEHYRHSIRQKTGNAAKIGAMEVANLCWYHGMDAAVIQFVKCADSRNLLPYFVLAYFSQRVASNQELFDEEASRLGRSILEEATRWSKLSWPLIVSSLTTNDRNENWEAATSSLLPLYLQWEGHSVTVVGIEPVSDGNSPLSANLLVLDPLKESRKLVSDLGWNSCHTNPTEAVVSLSQPPSLPTSAKLPWSQISKKDLQILVCTGRSMTYAERQSCKNGGGNRGRVMTASEEAVRKHLNNRYQR